MEFANAFVQQLVLFLVFAAISLIAVFIGIFLRKRKNRKEELKKAELEETEQNEEA